jgi:hypothetical protein
MSRYDSTTATQIHKDGIRGRDFGTGYIDGLSNELALKKWEIGKIAGLGSIETLGPAIDKYGLIEFAADDPDRFHELVSWLPPRDQEIMICFAILKKRPTDLSKLFGKAGHRAEEDLHKAAHKLAGLIECGPLPEIGFIAKILKRHGLAQYGSNDLAVCIWQYARCRDFSEMSRIIGNRGLRQEMLKVFKILHATDGREEGLLAGWILWLVQGANEKGKGWHKRTNAGRALRLGPTVFRSDLIPYSSDSQTSLPVHAAERGGRGQLPHAVTIKRHMKFLRCFKQLRGANA